MLTRLRVKGFKNLVDADVRFGPFTCIAGANGAGKSNLLDAILFLGSLADMPLQEAALSVRDQGRRTGDIRGLFHRAGDRFTDTVEFEAEMLIPPEGEDDLGQIAHASATLVRYSVALRYRVDPAARGFGSLELIREELRHITQQDAKSHLQFPHHAAWRKMVVSNRRRTTNFLSTVGEGTERFINVHQDGGSSGRPQKLRAATLPRTVLSASNSAETPTAALVKREMRSWRLLQLEPSALREPDNFTAPAHLASDGSHLPSTLYHLAHLSRDGSPEPDSVLCELANRLSELIDDIHSISVDRDERRQLLTLFAKGRDGTMHPARSLSDGTLRFLALAVLSMSPESNSLVCMEEPENGIHPARIPAMIRLLSDLAAATDTSEPSQESALRQVIINTHSPAVVQQIPDDSLLVAETVHLLHEGTPCQAVRFSPLDHTWRADPGGSGPVSKGKLMSYLNPVPALESAAEPDPQSRPSKQPRRVIDRPDFRQYRLGLEDSPR